MKTVTFAYGYGAPSQHMPENYAVNYAAVQVTQAPKPLRGNEADDG